MRNPVIICLLLFFCREKAHAQNPGDAIFDAAYVHQINILISQTNYWDSLQYYKEQGDVTGENIYMHCDVVFDNDTIYNVGLRLRGNSSYSHPGTKKPIKLKFNEFVQGQDCDNLKAIDLNNSANDPTQIREKLFLDILNENGITAPRCAFAWVSYNNQPVGLYKLVEPIDKTFLQTHFNNNERNLFKGEPNTPLTWEGYDPTAYYDNFELVTNEAANNWSDLIALLNTINHSGTGYQSSIEEAFNIDGYIKSWAANNLFGNLDTYLYLPHNFYLYNDSVTNKFQWITWDVGLVFGVMPVLFENPEKFDILYLPDDPSTRPLNYFTLETEAFRQQYLSHICYLNNQYFLPYKIFPRIDSLANVVRPYVNAEPVTNRMYTTNQFEGNLNDEEISSFLFFNIPGVKSYINGRRKSVQQQLCNLQWNCGINDYFTEGANKIISIYPNPTNNQVNIQLAIPADDGYSKLIVYNMMGEIVWSGTETTNSNLQLNINTSDWPAGAYLMQINGGCVSAEKKLIVIR